MKTPWYYSLLISIAKPIYRILLAVNSEKRDTVGVVTLADEFTMRFAKRFPSKLPNPENKPSVWVHAVSLGETNTVAPIIEKLLADGYDVVVTNTTHTGFARVEELFNSGDKARVSHSFIVVDSKREIRKFLLHFQPKAALFVETELWPNILAELNKQNIPSVLVNARLSDKSYTGYAKFSGIAKSMMANLSHIICQDEPSLENFHKLGANKEKLTLSPSLKFAVTVPEGITQKAQTLVQDWSLQNRQIIIAASMHEGEEVAMLTAFSSVIEQYPDAVLIIVPRHPERFDAVADSIESMNFELYRRSVDDVIDEDTQVYLADSMGELLMWYELTNHVTSGFTLVGGSLVNGIGGHNPLEASMLGVPVMMGPHTQKAQVVVDTLVNADAMRVVNNQEVLTQQLSDWLAQPERAKQVGQNGLQVIQNHADAVTLQYEKLLPFLPKTNTKPS